MNICKNAKIKWQVCECKIGESVNPNLSSCDGKGEYEVVGNLGLEYSHQCRKCEPLNDNRSELDRLKNNQAKLIEALKPFALNGRITMQDWINADNVYKEVCGGSNKE